MQATDLHFIRLTGSFQMQGRLDELRRLVSIIYPLKFELFAGKKRRKKKDIETSEQNPTTKWLLQRSLQSKDWPTV